VGKWVSLCCTVGYKWVTVMDGVNQRFYILFIPSVMDGVKFEFNDIILLFTKNDSERK